MSEETPAAGGGETPTTEGWTKAADLVKARMAELGVSVTEIVRRSGLRPNTINGVRKGTGEANQSTLVALSAALEWHYEYLYKVVCGEAIEEDARKATEKAPGSASPLEVHLAKLAAGVAGVGALREEVANLSDVVHRIDGKIDMIAQQLPE